MKEAFVKARGDGLGFDLGRAAFTPEGGDPFSRRATVSVDGAPDDRWTFSIQAAGSREADGGSHWVTVARGPPEDVVDAFGVFKKTLTKGKFGKEEWREALDAPEPGFSLLSMSDLVPDDRKDEFEENGGDVMF